MKESFSSEHGSELLGDPLEELLDGGGVTNEGGGHGETSGWNITHCHLENIHENNLLYYSF